MTTFRERWCVQGALEVESGLHVGDGSTTQRPDSDRYSALWRNEKQTDGIVRRRSVNINSTAMGLGARPHGQPSASTSAVAPPENDSSTTLIQVPIIPGSALKGVIRGWMELAFPERTGPQVVEKLLGHALDRVDFGSRSEATFLDSFMTSCPDGEAVGRFWCEQRSTCVASGVAIDREGRAASDEKLYFHEFIPAGAVFRVTLPLALSDPNAQIPYLLAALQAFNVSPRGRIRLGAHTRGGWGLLKWTLTALHRMTKEDAQSRLANSLEGPASLPTGFPLGPALALQDLELWKRRAVNICKLAKPRSVIRLSLHLAADSSFLVNDAARTQPADAASDHLPLRVTADGDFLLPGKSLHGALRSQAERIVRTILQDRQAAWPADQDQRNAPAFRKISEFHSDIKKLCPVSLLFGAPGWAAPLAVSAFCGSSNQEEKKQEFIAIDRLTGGGADHLKFNAMAPRKCHLNGEIELDLDALQTAVGGLWPAVLLPMALRDLDEQDILLGFGGSKGYGRFHIESCKVEAGRSPENQILCALLTWPKPAISEGHETVRKWIARLETWGHQFSQHQAAAVAALGGQR